MQVPDSDKLEDVSASLSDSNAKAVVKPVSVNDVKPFSESSFADSSHLHSFYFCKEEHCPDISKTEHDRIKTRDSVLLDKNKSYEDGNCLQRRILRMVSHHSLTLA